jgi:hypothetical protein
MNQDELKTLLSYNSDTGVFTWNKRGSGVKKDGSAGWKDTKGYVKIEIGGKAYAAHRLAWLMVYGVEPSNQIDHIDGNKSNNAISNLREATNAQNKQNIRKARADNKCGLLGAYWYKAGRTWRSEIGHNGKSYFLGNFPTAELAHLSYVDAKRRLHEFGTI